MTLLAFLVLTVWLVILARSPWREREVLRADAAAEQRRQTNVTALIPARNEADVIAACLRSAAPQVARVIVIDDESTDDTAVRAAGIEGVEVIHGTAKPPGWSGKLWALQQGLTEADTPYLLLLDADIQLDRHLVKTMYAKMHHEGIVMLSLMVSLRMQSWLERWLIPPFVFFFRLIYPFHRVNSQRYPVAAAAGGCVLLERTALERVNAFESIRNAIIDDCTLAAQVKGQGMRVWIGVTRSARSLRRYDRFAQVWQMVTRTAYTQLGYSKLLLAACTLLMLATFWFPLWIAWSGSGWERWLGLASLLAMFLSYAPLLRFYDRSVLWVLGLPVAALAYLAMTWGSAIVYWRGTRSRWKDRTYPRSVVG